jgi:hypothetical protein
VWEELLQNCCTSVWQKMCTQVLQKDEMYKEVAEKIVLLAD